MELRRRLLPHPWRQRIHERHSTCPCHVKAKTDFVSVNWLNVNVHPSFFLILSFFLYSPFALLHSSAQAQYDYSRLKSERLDRGVVAFRTSADSVVVTWRYLPSDPDNVCFSVIRDGRPIVLMDKNSPTFFRDYLPAGQGATYEIRAIPSNGMKRPRIKERKGQWTIAPDAPVGFLNIPLNRPHSGNGATYNANDATIADLDGDGQMEIILKWDPSDSRDNSQSGLTSPTLIDAYKLDGKHLWRINLGRNIRSGAHYTQFLVADFDSNGRAELICRTSDGVIDGKGRILGDPTADHRAMPDTTAYQANNNPHEQFRGPGWPNNMDPKARRGGFIYKGPEWVTVFDGCTGAAICSTDYLPQRGEIRAWGDNYANRSDRFLAATAYLDGEHLSAVFCRGYYTRTGIAAYDFDGRSLRLRWLFDTDGSLLPPQPISVTGLAGSLSDIGLVAPDTHQKDGHSLRSYAGQGNHNLRVADVDGDGRDEITYGSMAVDDDGIGLYNTRFGHGDAMHLTAFLPNNDALQVWDCHENKRDGSELRDARTGRVLFQLPSGKDVGRCMAADIDATNPGLEMWSSASNGIRNISGETIDSTARIPINFGIWWDGDLLRELLDHETVTKYRPATRSGRSNKTDEIDSESGLGSVPFDFTGSSSVTTLAHFDGCAFNNGTKSNPALCADILGDWREEVLTRTTDNSALRIYISPIPTRYRFHTFLTDPVYRHSVTMQNVAYNQPTNVGFYFGAELEGSGTLFRGWQF